MPMGPPVGANRMGQERWRGRSKGSGVGWTVTYYVLLVTGAVGFWKALWMLTESERRLVEL